MKYSCTKSALLFLCVAVALCTSTAEEASPHRGGGRKLLDGVQLQKFDSLISLKRPDGSDITPASLYNSMRDAFNGYFAQEAAGPKEGRLLAQGTVTTTSATAATPQVVDMTNSNLEKFMLSSRPPSARAKIEDPNASEATFTGTGQLVSGGRKLSQSGRVSINAPVVQRRSAPVTPGRVSIDTPTTVSQQAAASGFLASRAKVESAPTVVDMTNSQLEQTLLAPPNANGKAKMEDPNGVEATFSGSGQLLSGGRKLAQAAAAAKMTAPTQQAAASQFLASRVKMEAAPTVVDMTHSNLEETLLAPPNANGKAKMEDPNGVEATFSGSGQLLSGGRKLAQAAAAKMTAPTQQAAASQFLASRVKMEAAPTVVDLTHSNLEETLLAPPNANGKAKMEDPNGVEATFSGSGQLLSGGRH